MTFCGNCGTNNPAGNRFCYNCGAELTVPPEVPQLGYNPTMNNEVERIGPYDPNASYYNPAVGMPQQQQYAQQQYQQPYQQYPPYQQYQPYQQPYPPMGYPPQQKSKEPIYLAGAPNNATSIRWVSIILSVATLILVMATLCAIPVDDGGKTLLSLGLDSYVDVLAFVAMAIVMGVIGLLIPMFSIVTGVCIIGAVALLLERVNTMSNMMLIIIALAIVIMVLGMIASLLMNKYVRSNVRNVNMFQCNLWTWTGIRVPQEVQDPYNQYQYRY